MKTAPAAVTNYLVSSVGSVAFRADLYTLSLLDGTIFRWTTCDRSITVSGNTYLADGSVLSRGNLRTTSRLEVDSIDIMLGGAVLISGQTIALQAVQGFFDDARLRIDHIVGSDLANAISNGPVVAWFEGIVTTIVPQATQVRMTVASELITLGIKLPRFSYAAMCQYAVYDPNCTLNKATFTLAGTTSATGSTTTFTSTTAGIIAKASGYFDLGVVTFTSGALTGVRASIKSSVLSGGTTTFTVALPLTSAPVGGVTFNVYPGCHRDKADCGTAKFNNLVNFRGFVHIPKPEAAN